MPPSPNSRRFYAKKWLAAIVGFGVIAVLAVSATLYRQPIIDWWRLRDYQPPAAISTLATQDTMTGHGRKVFYVNHPVLNSKSSFADNCPTEEREQTIVLGCYHAGQSGIFLLDVNDSRLDGVEQVTAAHEMLHGAYERLSASDRDRVDTMLFDYYHNSLRDRRILKTIEAYKKTEPDAVVNEMHSVFGTEVARLPGGLEKYYKRYFTDRSRVAAYATKYQAEFTSREAQRKQYEAELNSLKPRIERSKNDLQVKRNEIDVAYSSLLAKKNSGDINGYNAGVAGYNNMVTSYNAEVRTVKDLVDRYNQIVTKRNAIALEENQLIKALSADVAPIEQ